MKRFNVAVARKSMEQNRTEKAHFTETDVVHQNYNFNIYEKPYTVYGPFQAPNYDIIIENTHMLGFVNNMTISW